MSINKAQPLKNIKASNSELLISAMKVANCLIKNVEAIY